MQHFKTQQLVFRPKELIKANYKPSKMEVLKGTFHYSFKFRNCWELKNTHTYTRTQTHTYSHVQINANTRIRTYKHTHAHIDTIIYTQTYPNTLDYIWSPVTGKDWNC